MNAWGWEYSVERSAADLEEAERYLRECEDSSEAWEGRGIRRVIAEANASWILGLARWRLFLTLTFREETPADKAWRRYFSLVRALNVGLLGKHYTKKVGHSYFAYAVGMERQARGVVHFHALIDRPVDFAKVHGLWKAWAGWAHTSVIRDCREAVRYVSKYTLKGGDVQVYLPKREWVPSPLPAWWLALAGDGRDALLQGRGAEGLPRGGSLP